MINVLLTRGHQVTPWDLRPWEYLGEPFDVRYLRTPGNDWDDSSLNLQRIPVSARRDSGRIGRVAVMALGERYRQDADRAFAGADIVHGTELAAWHTADAARRRSQGASFKLVASVWETLPLGAAYRNRAANRYRDLVKAHCDLFLAMTERARTALLLEGIEPERIVICSPGIDVEGFAAVAGAAAAPTGHTIISPGRLIWEKGHQDVIRALALLRAGIVASPVIPRLMIVGSGPEADRLARHAQDLGVGDLVSFAAVAYEEMPAVFASASCLVLGSQAAATGALYRGALPQGFWEEQFGYVFVEAMAARLPIITTTSGAIPEVLAGGATLVAPGDHVGIAKALAAGPLAASPGVRANYSQDLLCHYSLAAMARRLEAAYDRVLDS